MTALSAAAVVAEEGTTGEVGTLTMKETTYPLKHAVAYETNIADEDAIAVLLTGQAVSREKLNETRDSEKEGGDPDFTRPFLKLVFTMNRATTETNLRPNLRASKSRPRSSP